MTEQQFLESYDAKKYPTPSLTSDIVAFCVSSEVEEKMNHRKLPQKTLNILMVKRKEHPYKGMWALPGGFLREDETLEECAARELKEETNVSNVYMEHVGNFSRVDRDPRTRVVTSAYMALLNTRPQLVADTDAEETAWFKLKVVEKAKETRVEDNFKSYASIYEICMDNGTDCMKATVAKTIEFKGNTKNVKYTTKECENLAFDHGEIILMAVDKLRKSVEREDGAFNLVEETFTLKAIQEVYELVLDTTVLAGNFRKKIAPLVEETDQEVYSGSRKAKLYRRVLAEL